MSSVTFAAANPVFDIASKIFIDGKLASTPHIIAKLDQKSSINLSNKDKNNLTIELVAKDLKVVKKVPAIEIDSVIKLYEGDREIIYSKPILRIGASQTGTFSVIENGHSFKMDMIVRML